MLHYKDEQYLESIELPFYCAKHPLINGEEIALHYHNFVEMVYVAEGSGLHEYKGERYRISKGDMFVIEPGVPHAYKADAGHFLVYNLLFQSCREGSSYSNRRQDILYIGQDRF
jgi:mannose-6-phosphate isomerase-like protein (cupin superfamily)